MGRSWVEATKACRILLVRLILSARLERLLVVLRELVRVCAVFRLRFAVRFVVDFFAVLASLAVLDFFVVLAALERVECSAAGACDRAASNGNSNNKASSPARHRAAARAG